MKIMSKLNEKDKYVVLTPDEAQTILQKLKQADLLLHLAFKKKIDLWN